MQQHKAQSTKYAIRDMLHGSRVSPEKEKINHPDSLPIVLFHQMSNRLRMAFNSVKKHFSRHDLTF